MNIAGHFPIIQISDDEIDDLEQLGTKEKYWLENRKYLLKIGRQNTGEHWAEKVACELGQLLGLPHADYDFACFNGKIGVITQNIVPEKGYLTHGNELLAQFDETYPILKKERIREHSIPAVMEILKKEAVEVPESFSLFDYKCMGIDIFIGYLLMDAWIANQDCHDENWGLISIEGKDSVYLAPTFDHTSSMGRNECDERRRQLIDSNDGRNNIESYVKRALSCFYDCNDPPKRINTVDAFYIAAEYSPPAALGWLNLLDQIEDSSIVNIFNRIPENLISRETIDFTIKMLWINKKRLLERRGELR